MNTSTDANAADMLTKPLDRARFNKHRDYIMNVSAADNRRDGRD